MYDELWLPKCVESPARHAEINLQVTSPVIVQPLSPVNGSVMYVWALCGHWELCRIGLIHFLAR